MVDEKYEKDVVRKIYNIVKLDFNIQELETLEKRLRLFVDNVSEIDDFVFDKYNNFFILIKSDNFNLIHTTEELLDLDLIVQEIGFYKMAEYYLHSFGYDTAFYFNNGSLFLVVKNKNLLFLIHFYYSNDLVFPYNINDEILYNKYYGVYFKDSK